MNSNNIFEESYKCKGIDILTWSDENPEVAIISFSSMNPGKFERWSWFTQNKLSRPAAYIFLKDEAQHFYLGAGNAPASQHIAEEINSILHKHQLPPHKAISVGSSMGGYGAIYYAVYCNLAACISINPQTNLDSAMLHKYGLWTRKMKEASWQDLPSLIEASSHPINTYFEIHYGLYPADLDAAEKLIKSMTGKCPRLNTFSHDTVDHGWVGFDSSSLIKKLNQLSINF